MNDVAFQGGMTSAGFAGLALPDLDLASLHPNGPDLLGYLAAAVVFTSFCMQTMLLLRIVAVISNIAFISYALSAGLVPILILHGAMLPLNLWRLIQMRRLPQLAERARQGDGDFRWLAETGVGRDLVDGEVLFARGDAADSMFVVETGEIEIPEVGVRLGPGDLFGEIALFAADGRRTATARAQGATRVSELTGRRVRQLHYDNPAFAYALVRLITTRLLDNHSRGKAAATVDAGPGPLRAAPDAPRVA